MIFFVSGGPKGVFKEFFSKKEVDLVLSYPRQWLTSFVKVRYQRPCLDRIAMSVSDTAVIEQKRRKFLYRKMRLPVRVENKQCVEGLDWMRDDLKGLERGVAPGTAGLRNEYLVVLTEKMIQRQMDLLESYGRKYLLKGQKCSPSTSNPASTIPSGASFGRAPSQLSPPILSFL